MLLSLVFLCVGRPFLTAQEEGKIQTDGILFTLNEVSTVGTPGFQVLLLCAYPCFHLLLILCSLHVAILEVGEPVNISQKDRSRTLNFELLIST